MKKAAKALCLILMFGLVVTGCGKKSRLEGRVVDGAGKPITGLKIIARKAKPVKGDDQFEATAGSDGLFSFNALYPETDYFLTPQVNDFGFSIPKIPVRSALEGGTVVLRETIVLRFAISKDGLILDSLTGLQWRPDVLQHTLNWNAAAEFAKNLKQGRHSDWRLPTRAELKSLYDPLVSGEIKIHPVFRISDCCLWSSEPKDSASAWGFNFRQGIEMANPMDTGLRVLAVRSTK